MADYSDKWTDKELLKLEKRIAGLYKQAEEELETTIADYFDSFARRDEEMKKLIGTIQNGREWTEADYKQWRLNQIGRGKRFEALRDEMAARYTDANAMAVAYANDATPGIYSLNRNYAAYTIDKGTGGALTMPEGKVDASWTLFDESTVRRLAMEQPDLMPHYPKSKALKRGIDLAYGKRQITATVASAILQGKSIGGIADILQTRITDMNRNSAIRAARTSVTGAQNAGRMDTYRAAEKMGIKLQKEWLATLDNRTRHAHALLDGQKRPTDKPFEVDGDEIMFPGDPSAKGYLVYNCRCTLVAALDGVDTSDTMRRAKDPKTGKYVLIKDMTYQEWAGWASNVVKQATIPQHQLQLSGLNGTIKTVNSDESVFDSIISKQQGMSQDYKTVLEDRFANGTEDAKKAFNKYVPSDSVSDSSHTGTAHFNPASQKINMNYANDLQNKRGPGATFFHEHGHYIDFMATGKSNYEFLSSNSQSFGLLLRSDFKAYVDKYKKLHGVKTDNAYNMISFDLIGHGKHSLSDLIDGISKGRCSGQYGHKRSYWTTPGALENEAFAHMFEAQFDGAKHDLMKQYFPSSLAEFERMLKGLI